SQLLISRQTTFRRFERRETATFLLDQVILYTADRLGGVEDFEPGRSALAEQQTIAFPFARGPLLEVKRSDAPLIGPDPGDRIGAGVYTCAHVELQRHILRRVGGEHFHWALAIYRNEFQLVIMESGAHLQRFELLRGLSESFSHALPAIESFDASGAGHHNVLGAQNLVEFDSFLKAFGSEGVRAVVSGKTADAQIV